MHFADDGKMDIPRHPWAMPWPSVQLVFGICGATTVAINGRASPYVAFLPKGEVKKRKTKSTNEHLQTFFYKKNRFLKVETERSA
jgi:hypothetical protein